MNCRCRNSLLFIVSFFIFTHCTKSTSKTGGSTVPPTGPTVYIAGDNGTNPILWKNGIADTLSPTVGSANRVLVSGQDVYVSGTSHVIMNPTTANNPSGLTGQFVYWKNEIQNNIDSFGPYQFPTSISVSGNNVYYSNWYGWKNGTKIFLPGNPVASSGSIGGGVVSTFTVGNDVYFAGYDTLGSAVVWKNNTMSIVSLFNGHSSNDNPIISCMFVSGEDVYVGGMLGDGLYWKNGTANYLPRLDGAVVGEVSSVFVSGNDIYTAGIILPRGNSYGAAYWKDTVMHTLQVTTPPGVITSYATTSIFVSGTDIYVAGNSLTFDPSTNAYRDSAIYWKNGVEIPLHSSGTANSIYVQ
jgi:hypothetical protein